MKSSAWMIFAAAFTMSLGPVCASAQSQQPTATLLRDKTQLGFAFTPEVKFTKVNGEFAALAGGSLGLVVKPDFLVGVGAYAKITDVLTNGYMGYGGIILEYSRGAHRMVHFSIGGLLGGGSAQSYPLGFFVAEPQGKVSVNVTRWFRLGFGGGYRFVAGAHYANSWLRGPVAGISLMLGNLSRNP